MLKFAIYVSDHGFGHATRMAALAEEFIRFGIAVHIRSARPDFIFSRLDGRYCRKDSVACDVGARHGANLVADLEQTKAAVIGLMSRRLDIVGAEIEFLRENNIDLIVSDVPWLVVEAGAYAGVPVFAVSNFEWLYIYDGLFGGDREIRPLLNTIFGLYQRADHAFRLPFSSAQSMGAFLHCQKTGLLAAAKDSYRDPHAWLGLDPQRPILACTFGGAGTMDFDLAKLCRAYPGYVVTGGDESVAENHVTVSPDADYLDLIHGCEVIFTKPGYGIFAEATQFGKPIIYHPRRNYPEEEVLIGGIAKYAGQRRLERIPNSVKGWKEVLAGLPERQGIKKTRNANAAIAARMVQRYLQLRQPKADLVSVFDAGSNNLNYALCDRADPIPLHTAQISTGLGLGFKADKNGKVRLAAGRINAFKRSVAQLIKFDRQIDSQKAVLATGIHRHSDAPEQLAAWFSERWGLNYRILTEKEEAELAGLAAGTLIPPGQTALIADIGGFSTELTLRQPGKPALATSLPIGLLCLKQAVGEGQDPRELIRRELEGVSLGVCDTLISIGLAPLFLARLLYKQKMYDPGQLHGKKLPRSGLERLRSELAGGGGEELAEFMMEPGREDIIRLNLDCHLLLMDKFGCAEIVVCPLGISAGYGQWRKSKRKAKG